MRVVLREDVERLGRRGDIVEVSKGFARNFLVPSRRAVPATAGIEAQAAAMRRARDQREAAARQAAEQAARTLTGATVRVVARAGAGGRLFGSVTAADVAAACQEQLDVVFDRRRLHLEEPIKTVGRHEVAVQLHPDVVAHFSVEVEAEGA
ncbi:50S ribosomal protein L9 [Aciditerrimonas ferrireducens]|jgi:large subunit ribosomal protein L9|uniref:Large ribosomal subunit protein bL9 n=1 Tax=Aciditerrimonas ferrireducens TaxID=667306 RepID=A0ABV6BYU6_9ACTN|nr:50S ribosomal protein L9 [Aciditerrimonas ferrireducens]MCK4176965.1 50S ribosomal protein L9 [Aciditerrimonas ferrireducens]